MYSDEVEMRLLRLERIGREAAKPGGDFGERLKHGRRRQGVVPDDEAGEVSVWYCGRLMCRYDGNMTEWWQGKSAMCRVVDTERLSRSRDEVYGNPKSNGKRWHERRRRDKVNLYAGPLQKKRAEGKEEEKNCFGLGREIVVPDFLLLLLLVLPVLLLLPVRPDCLGSSLMFQR